MYEFLTPVTRGSLLLTSLIDLVYRFRRPRTSDRPSDYAIITSSEQPNSKQKDRSRRTIISNQTPPNPQTADRRLRH